MRVVDTSAWIEWLIDSPLRALLVREMPADLLTCDAHFDGLPGVVYVAKTG